jgi:hypothetical protein
MKHLVAALVAAATAVPAKAGTKGQEEEGEENFGRGECVRRVAHEVK